jgi:CRISPR-associated protein Csd1
MLPAVTTALTRVALYGGKLPLDLLARLVRRNLIEKDVTYPRASLIKMILTTQDYPMNNMQSVNLDPELQPPDRSAFHYGRLLALLEKIQWEAYREETNGKGVNATVIDRYYGAASITPVRVMGLLLKDAQSHLSKLRKNPRSYGAYVALQEQLEIILSYLSPSDEKSPKTLSLQQQSIFALGYYHQRAASRKAANDNKAEKQAKAKKDEAEKSSSKA